MNVLVTGGMGFVGSHVVLALAKRGDKVVVYDSFVTADAMNLKDIKNRIELVKGDILAKTFVAKLSIFSFQ